MATKITLNQNAPINEVRLGGFYWTKLARDGHGAADKEQIFVRFLFGREVNGVFEQFGFREFAIEPADYGAAVQTLLGNIETGALNKFVAQFGGTVS